MHVYYYININNLLCVIIITINYCPYQAVILKEFDHKVICINSTFKSSGYNFTLISVLIIDGSCSFSEFVR